MTDLVIDLSHRDSVRVADKALKTAARLWFLVAVIGQWIFVYYVMFFYGAAAAQGDSEALRQIPGDSAGNFAMAMHLILAVIIMVGGPLQLVLGAIISGDGPRQLTPQIQTRVRSVHYWNGRIYLLTAVATSIAGLYMIWTRGTVGGAVGEIGISLDAVLIIICAAMVLRYALAREIVTHRRWALRLFMVVSAVWFFRVGLWLWVFLTGGIGVDFKTFTGPFLTFLFFAQYLLPLAVLELYIRTQDRAGAFGKFAMAAGLFVLTAFMGVGIFAAATMSWLPRL
ncbi:MAG: DUF2306 domain-containing protein [Proteobacteria bacterium]|nr:DUF2306 domain-containing protein [Pseudomonadota bacterium]